MSDERESLRRSPLDAHHRALGARLVAFGGWSMPLAYPEGTIVEHLECRRGGVVFDVSHLGTVRVDGPGAFDRLQWALSNDLRRIGPGRAQYSHLLDDDGSVLDDVIVWWRAEASFDVMPNASNTARVLAALGGTDVTAERVVLALQGPAARARLASLLPEAAAVGRFAVRTTTYRQRQLVVAGTGYTGEDGVEIAAPLEVADALFEDVLSAGLRPAGLGARDTLRLEAGLPLHGHELGPGITPFDAGLGWVVRMDKGDFRGRAALAARMSAPPTRALRGLVGASRRPFRAEDVVDCGEAGTGVVSSGGYSPILARGIALAFLPPGVPTGAPVEVIGRGGNRHSALVVSLPFVRRGSPVVPVPPLA